MKSKIIAALESYARSFIVAIATAYSLGVHDPQSLAIAGLIAIAGPAIRALNSNDPAFGRVADEVTALLKAKKKK